MTIYDKTILLEEKQFLLIPPGVSRQILEASEFNDVCILNFTCESPGMDVLADKIIVLNEFEIDFLLKTVGLAINILKPVVSDEYTGFTFRPDIDPCTSSSLKLYIELFLTILYNRLKNIDELNLIGQNIEKSDSKIISEIKEFMVSHINQVLTLDDIAGEFNMSSTTLKRMFKKETGRTTMHYFNSLKIARARSLLKIDGMTAEKVSRQLGFCSPTHFSTTFKKHTGETPYQYASRHTKFLPHKTREIPIH